jgi:hypothetical protein
MDTLYPAVVELSVYEPQQKATREPAQPAR